MTTYCAMEDRTWVEVSPGVEFCHLRREDAGDLTVLIRMAAGARAPMHGHPGGEETYMISGSLRVGEHTLNAGDYLWTPPGVRHDGYAEKDSEFFVVLPGGLEVDASTAS